MKLNKSLSIALTSVLLAGATSCSLDEVNLSSVSTEQEWSTPAGYQKKINDCYFDLVRITYGQAEDTYVMATEAGTDIWQDANPTGTNGNWSKMLRYESYDATAAYGMLWEGYTSLYATLNSCNAAIAYADKVTGLSQDRINELVAEAHFIRAHVLFNIVEQWGGKYLSTEFTQDAISAPQCSKVNDFYDVILSDLEFAKKYLPIKQEITGHVIRAAAYHLHAKACLTYATYTDGLGYVDALSEADARKLLTDGKASADYLIDNAASLGVKLYADVNDVFDENNNKTNAEALFVVTHSTVQAYNPRGNYYNRAWKHWQAFNANTSGVSLDGLVASYATEVNGVTVPKLAKGNCYMMPSKYMIDLYGPKDMRYDAFFDDVYYVNNANSEDKLHYTWTATDAKRYNLDESRVGNPAFDIELGDTAVYLPRHTYTQAERDACRYAIYNISDNYADPNAPLKFFPSLSKGNNPSQYAGSNASKPYSSSDCIIYRLGETYLLAAEINWRLGQPEVGRINALRNRACEGHDNSLNVAVSDINQDFLLDEYAREMIGEWSRWFTLKRFRAFESRLAKCNPQVKKFEKNYYLRPIPLGEILLIDNPEEYQNPGF